MKNLGFWSGICIGLFGGAMAGVFAMCLLRINGRPGLDDPETSGMGWVDDDEDDTQAHVHVVGGSAQ